MLVPSAENLRAEISRYQLSREAIGGVIGMHPNQLSMYVTGSRTMTEWAAHNIGWSINHLTKLRLFAVDMKLGPLEPPRGRPGSYTRLDDLPRRAHPRRRQRSLRSTA